MRISCTGCNGKAHRKHWWAKEPRTGALVMDENSFAVVLINRLFPGDLEAV